MTESLALSKERGPEERPREPEPDEPADYYYDDSTGYRVYDPEEDDKAEDEQEEE